MRRIFTSFPFRIFLIALVLRLIPVIAMWRTGIGLDDMFQYDMLARSLATGNGFRWYAYDDLKMLEPYVNFDLSTVEYDPERGVPTSFRAPLYPLFLSIIYFIGGTGSSRFLAARLVQTIISASLAPLTFSVAKSFLPFISPDGSRRSDRAATISASIVAGYPLLILYPFGLATENLFFPFVLLSFQYLLKLTEKATTSRIILAGLFLGLAALTRSVILPFGGLAILWLWFSLKNHRGAIVLGLTILVVISPWIVRNSILHQKLMGIESSMGYNLYVGYHPKSDGSFTFGVSLDLIPILDDAERDRIGTSQALTFIQNDPARFLHLALNRLSFFFGLEKRVLMYFYANNFLGYISPIPLILIFLVLLAPFVLVAGSAPIGLAELPVKPKTMLLWLLFGAYLLPHVFILSEDRFHLAIVPFLAILAAYAWAGGWAEIRLLVRESKGARTAIFLAFFAILLLLANWTWEILRDVDKLVQILGPEGNILYPPY